MYFYVKCGGKFGFGMIVVLAGTIEYRDWKQPIDRFVLPYVNILCELGCVFIRGTRNLP